MSSADCASPANVTETAGDELEKDQDLEETAGDKLEKS
jgi:hypothetical protein